MSQLQKSLEDVNTSTEQLKNKCEQIAEAYEKDFVLKIKNQTARSQRISVDNLYQQIEEFENVYRDELNNLKETQSIASKNFEDAIASYTRIGDEYDKLNFLLNDIKIGSLKGLARDKINIKDIPKDTFERAALDIFIKEDQSKMSTYGDKSSGGRGSGKTGKRIKRRNIKRQRQSVKKRR